MIKFIKIAGIGLLCGLCITLLILFIYWTCGSTPNPFALSVVSLIGALMCGVICAGFEF